MPVRVAGDQFSPVICLRDIQRLTYQLHSRCSLGWPVHSNRGVRFSFRTRCVFVACYPRLSLFPPHPTGGGFRSRVLSLLGLFPPLSNRWRLSLSLFLSPFIPFVCQCFLCPFSTHPSHPHTAIRPYPFYGRLTGLREHYQRLDSGSLTVPLPVWASPSAYVCSTCVSDGCLRPHQRGRRA